jgi:hypothetical protein
VRARREREGAPEQILIDVRVVGRDLGEQLLDEVLMSFRSLEKRHGQIVLRPSAATVWGLPARERTRGADGELMPPVLKRLRRRRKAIADLTRMLSVLEEGSRTGRPWARRRVSVGRAF